MIVADGTVNFEFSNLTSNEPHLTCSVKMDVNSQNQWEGKDLYILCVGVSPRHVEMIYTDCHIL